MASLTVAERFATISINKKCTGTFSYLLGGDTVTSMFTFKNISGYPVFNLVPPEVYLNFFMSNTIVNPTLNIYQPPTTDKVVALIHHNLYVLARQ